MSDQFDEYLRAQQSRDIDRVHFEAMQGPAIGGGYHNNTGIGPQLAASAAAGFLLGAGAAASSRYQYPAWARNYIIGRFATGLFFAFQVFWYFIMDGHLYHLSAGVIVWFFLDVYVLPPLALYIALHIYLYRARVYVR